MGIFGIIVLILMGGAMINKGIDDTLYRDALANSVYSVLDREGYIDVTELKKGTFKTNIVKKVIPMGNPITSDEDIERQTDLIIHELVAQGFHKMPINQEFFMNMVKVEYHVTNRGKKAGRALVTIEE